MIIRYGSDITAGRDGYYVTTWIEDEGLARPLDILGPVRDLDGARAVRAAVHATTKRLVDQRIAEIRASLTKVHSAASDAHRMEAL